MSAYLENLTALLPSLKHHMPATGVMVAELLGELTIATKLGVVDARSGLTRDAENLHAGLSAVMEARMAGVGNADIDAAETALHALILDMRNRATSRIRDRTAMIRVNAEVSAHRADPDADVMDLTEGYRLMAAVPVHDDEQESLVIHDLGLPDKGGKSGRIEGDIMICSHAYPLSNGEGPLNTFYLPAGRCVNLSKGDKILLHTQGDCWQSRKITLDDFKVKSFSREIEAISDDVRIYGPATFEISSQHTFADIQDIYKKFDIDKKNISTVHKVMMSKAVDKALGNIALGATASAILFGVAENKTVALILSGVVISAIISAVFICLFESRVVKNFKKKGLLSTSLESKIISLISKEDDKKHIFSDASRKDVTQKVASLSSYRFYPLRKIIINENEGVRQIEPLKALSAPTPDISMSTVVPIRTKV